MVRSLWWNVFSFNFVNSIISQTAWRCTYDLLGKVELYMVVREREKVISNLLSLESNFGSTEQDNVFKLYKPSVICV